MAREVRRPLLAGNWKMNGLQASVRELREMIAGLEGLWERLDAMICPPATLVGPFSGAADRSPLTIGGQDCHAEPHGAFTGDISAEMLFDAGARAVIVGHSERRTYHKESDAAVRAKVEAALRAGLAPVICVGETRTERESGRTLDVIESQLEGSLPDGDPRAWIVAYEPVWAIGTGLTPSPGDVAQAHEFIRDQLARRFGAAADAVRILYGGSVKPSNARELMSVPDVDGALVGGASLKAADFLAIAEAYRV